MCLFHAEEKTYLIESAEKGRSWLTITKSEHSYFSISDEESLIAQIKKLSL